MSSKSYAASEARETSFSTCTRRACIDLKFLSKDGKLLPLSVPLVLSMTRLNREEMCKERWISVVRGAVSECCKEEGL